MCTAIMNCNEKTVRHVVIQLQVQYEPSICTHTPAQHRRTRAHTHARAHTPTHTRRAWTYYTELFPNSGRPLTGMIQVSCFTETSSSSSYFPPSIQHASFGSLRQSSPSQGGHPCLHPCGEVTAQPFRESWVLSLSPSVLHFMQVLVLPRAG